MTKPIRRRLVLAALIVPITAGRASADVIHVPRDQPTIQAGIDAATDGDEVLVAAGVYAERIDLRGKAIVVRGAMGPTRTAIDASGLDGSVVTFASGEATSTVLDGFTITGGTGTPGWLETRYGGGLFLEEASPTVRACVVTQNRADRGGGAYATGGAPVFVDTVFDRNTATRFGGGMLTEFDCDATFDGCTFSCNFATFAAGGAGVRGRNRFVNTCFVGNSAPERYYSGGALSVAGPSVEIIGCIFDDNDADGGGAVSILSYGIEATITSCVFTQNRALYGSALNLRDAHPITIRDCRFEANAGDAAGAIAAEACDLVMTDCVFERNTARGTGGVLYMWDSHLRAERCVFRHNAAYQAGALYRIANGLTATIVDCTFEGNTARDGGAMIETVDTIWTPLRFERCLFTGNVSERDGAAVILWKQGEFVDCVFRGNVAGDDGGAIACGGERTTIDGCTFERNSAASGAALAVPTGAYARVGTSMFCGNDPHDVDGPYDDRGGNVFCRARDPHDAGEVVH